MPTPLETTALHSRQRGGILFKLLLLMCIGGFLFTGYLARRPVLRSYADWWIVDDSLTRAQAIVVLGGDSVLGERVRHGVDLYRQELGYRLVLSGPSIRTHLNEADVMAREALGLGVPRDSILMLRHNADSTLEEALALRQYLTGLGVRRIIVVTSNYHTRRARTIFLRVFRQAAVEVQVSAAPDVRFNPRRWWEQRSGRKQMLLEWMASANAWWEMRELPAPAAVEASWE